MSISFSRLNMGRAAILALAMCTTSVPALARQADDQAAVRNMVARTDIPFERFTLDNGLTVIVHTDRKAPVVSVSVWYDIGSKDEPAGSTGFAHLFEHLMFNGSENAPGDSFSWLQDMGASDSNGSTNPDRTNYYETVPTGALDRALWLEADRMGHLLGAVTQESLDVQRGVVQNEKRQGDNQPYGLLRYYIFENLTPRGHPYHHSTIGSMDDLNAASLTTVQNWFRANYGPNNAVLVLAGDIDAATARPMVERWFGGIARGPAVTERPIDVPTLPAPLARVVTDQIATTRLFRMWAVPGSKSEDAPALDVAASVLGGLSSSRLDNALVRDEQVAVGVSASAQTFEDLGIFYVMADVKPGVDPAVVGRRLDEIVAQFLAEGPTADEVRRAVTSGLAGQISAIESVSGKAEILAESQLYGGDAGFFRTQLQRFAAATPESVKAVANRWLSRPVFALTYQPGQRTDSGDGRGGAVRDATAVAPVVTTSQFYRTPANAAEWAMGIAGSVNAPQVAYQAAPATPPAVAHADAAPATAGPAIPPPALQPMGELDFPAIERATLRNGIRVLFARRAAVPVVRATIRFDAGNAADPRERPGTQALMLNLMEEGTTTLDSRALAEAQERLGANIGTYSTADGTGVSMDVLSANLRPAMALWADIVRNPAFAPAEIERVRAQQLAGIAAELNSPGGLAGRVVSPLIFGPTHPYGAVAASGTVGSVSAITGDELTAFHQRWIRPDNATIYVIGDTNLRTVVRELNRTFGNWRAPAVARGTKEFPLDLPAQTPRILLVNRPNSPQSVIVGAEVLGIKGTDDQLVLRAANDVLGGNFLSRINMNLRETKHWSYGASSSIGGAERDVSFRISAPVQADKTGEAIREIQSDLNRFLSTGGVTQQELERTVNGSIRELPGQFELGGTVLNAIVSIDRLRRPDDYYEQLAPRYRALTAAELDAAARAQIDPSRLVYVVVGDAAVVRPQLDAVGLPVETVDIATLGGQ